MGKFELIAFDIDGTLTRSKLPLDEEMAKLLCRLLDKSKVAIISGANYEQFQWQILGPLKCQRENIGKLFLLPVDGSVFCHYTNGWQCNYDTPLSDAEKNQIKLAFENIFQKSDLEEPENIYGELIEDRGAQFNFSALGQDAPIELKENWDPDNKKREQMVKVLKTALPDFSMHIGGTTSIEITKAGIDKAYGLNKLMREIGISKEKMLYIGDKLFKGGNDEPALNLGIECRAVQSLDETKKVILDLLA